MQTHTHTSRQTRTRSRWRKRTFDTSSSFTTPLSPPTDDNTISHRQNNLTSKMASMGINSQETEKMRGEWQAYAKWHIDTHTARQMTMWHTQTGGGLSIHLPPPSMTKLTSKQCEKQNSRHRDRQKYKTKWEESDKQIQKETHMNKQTTMYHKEMNEEDQDRHIFNSQQGCYCLTPSSSPTPECRECTSTSESSGWILQSVW